MLSVQDRGPVIADTDRPSLFAPLHAHDADESRDPPSLALGLAMVERIATAHRGSVGVTSSEAEGTSFSVRLPLGDALS